MVKILEIRKLRMQKIKKKLQILVTDRRRSSCCDADENEELKRKISKKNQRCSRSGWRYSAS